MVDYFHLFLLILFKSYTCLQNCWNIVLFLVYSHSPPFMHEVLSLLHPNPPLPCINVVWYFYSYKSNNAIFNITQGEGGFVETLKCKINSIKKRNFPTYFANECCCALKNILALPIKKVNWSEIFSFSLQNQHNLQTCTVKSVT